MEEDKRRQAFNEWCMENGLAAVTVCQFNPSAFEIFCGGMYVQATLSQPADGWRPIEEAPKDGRMVLLLRNDDDVLTTIGFYRNDEFIACGVFHSKDEGFPPYQIRQSIIVPTHWQPLPQPPKGE